jgi:hypothetical protein
LCVADDGTVTKNIPAQGTSTAATYSNERWDYGSLVCFGQRSNRDGLPPDQVWRGKDVFLDFYVSNSGAIHTPSQAIVIDSSIVGVSEQNRNDTSLANSLKQQIKGKCQCKK